MGLLDAFTGPDAPWLFLILIVSVFALAIIIERFYVLYFKYNIDGAEFTSIIQKLIMQNNITKAVQHCDAYGEKGLAKVIKAGLLRANKNELEIGNAIEETTLEIVPRIQKRLGNLPVLANIATLMGLLGTIVGMIGAFQGLGDVSADKRQEMLSSGVSLAMWATAVGLGVATPCLIFHIFLNNKARQLIVDIDQYGTKINNLLVARFRGLLQSQQGSESSSE